LASQDTVLRDFIFSYGTEQSHLLDPSNEIGLQTWEHWERFNARFRALKSYVFDGETILWTELHNGACFGSDCGILFQCRKMNVAIATQCCSTKSNHSDFKRLTRCETGFVRIADCKSIVLCNHSNPAADTVCGIKLNSGSTVSECIQDKKWKKALSPQEFKVEVEKSVCAVDFFLLCVTSNIKIDKESIPPRCAIVDRSCAQNYYGPFAARAFYIMDTALPNVNTSSRTALEAVCGVGSATAAKILECRGIAIETSGKIHPFSDASELEVAFKACNNNRNMASSIYTLFSYGDPSR